MDKSNKKGLIKQVIPYIVIIIVVLLIKQFVFSTIVVHGESMETTLYNNDFMILDKISVRFDKIKRFDVVVVQVPGEKIIKRVVGLPGETVEYKDDQLYINGSVVEDDYGSNKTKDFGPVLLGSDEYYVLGDNRSISADSRYFGPFTKNKIIGKTNLVIFPFNRFGFKS